MLWVCIQEVKRGSTDSNTDDHLRDLRDGDDGGGNPLRPGVNGSLREVIREGGRERRKEKPYEWEYEDM